MIPDVMEIVCSSTTAKVSSHAAFWDRSLELIDEGETDPQDHLHCLERQVMHLRFIEDLERVKPDTLINTLKDWLKRYKTSDGASQKQSCRNPARRRVRLRSLRRRTWWKTLCGKDGTHRYTSWEARWKALSQQPLVAAVTR
jgi:hypothetical protein